MDHIDKDSHTESDDFSFDDLDNEVGLGNILKEKDNFFFLLFKKLVFAIVIVIIGIIVFFASFTIGKMMFLAEDTSSYQKNQPLQNQITENKKAMAQPTIESQVSMKSTNDETKNRSIPTQNYMQIKPQLLPQNTQKAEEIKPMEETISNVSNPSQVQQIEESYYMIVVGTFSKIQNARSLSDSLQKSSYSPTIKNIQASNGDTLFRVIAGIYKGLDETKKQIQILKSKGIDCFYQPFKE
ncbi:MAG: hypothetical protein A2Y40_05045 [Candidatus Margulisbacteria bacterium GWF2_35_9]|nr:MAG: hypothetical protein A2Y40_05045 [Candidatus Margulisbacteria bacterium GWF2_35_9]